MKVLIVSDTHRKDDNLEAVIEKHKPLDALIHLGDAEGSEHWIEQWVNEDCKLYMVAGNNDFFTSLNRELEIKLGPHKILMTHGHTYNVSLGVELLMQEALDRRCTMVMFGHTHRPFFDTMSGVTILNPGSLSYPRQEGRKPSYMIMTMNTDEEVIFESYFIDER